MKQIGDPTQCHAVAIDARAPKYDGGIITRLDCVVFGIAVNKHCQRFYDEGEDIWPKRYAIWGRLVAAQPDQIAYIIFDARSLRLFMPPLFPPITGASIEELAAKLELDPARLRETVDGFNAAVQPGAFYKIMPHDTMVAIFGAAFLWSVLAIVMSCVNFWRDIGEPSSTLRDPQALTGGAKDVATLKYLDGGGVGCMAESDKPDDNRRLYHHLTYYGFMLRFAATSVGTLWHYLMGWDAPYPWYDLPVVLGTLGGIGITVGPVAPLMARLRRDPQLMDESRKGMDLAFIVMLLLTGVTGLALLVLRATPLMGMMLALHLGFVFGFFITMPYGKFMHGIFRGLALVRYAAEKRRTFG